MLRERFTQRFACTDTLSETERHRSLMKTPTSDVAEAALAQGR
jgi:hypothetical protein